MTGRTQAIPHVVFVVSHLDPTMGLERAVLDLTRNLGAVCNVEVVSLGDDFAVSPADLQLTVLGPKRTGWRRIRSLPALRRYGRKADPDAVYIAAGAWASIPWLLAAPWLASRTLVWEHSLILENCAASRQLRVLKTLARQLFPRAAAVVCVSEALTRDVQKLNPRIRTVTIENAFFVVDEATLRARLDARTGAATRLLAVGSLTRPKNQEMALQVMRALPAAFTLTIAGDGPERSRLETLVAQWGLGGRVRFLGQVDSAVMAALYVHADVLVHPSVGETFGYVYFEAAEAGLPVLSLGHRVAQEFIPALVPGLLFDARTTDLLDKVRQFAAVPVDRDACLLARAARAGRLDPELAQSRWLGMIHQLTNDRALGQNDLERTP